MEYRTDVTRSGMDVARYYLIILPILGRSHGDNQKKKKLSLEEGLGSKRACDPSVHTIPASILTVRMLPGMYLFLRIHLVVRRLC